MPIKLIAMDLDGTLLNTDSRVPEENIRAIREAVARGIEIIVVTGRRYHSARLIVDALPERLHLIVNNGALIKTKEGETHQRMLLPAATARRVLEATPEFRSNAAVVFDRPKENQVIMEHIDWDDPFRGGYFRRSREFLAEVKPLEDCLPDAQAVVASGEWPFDSARRGKQAQDRRVARENSSTAEAQRTQRKTAGENGPGLKSPHYMDGTLSLATAGTQDLKVLPPRLKSGASTLNRTPEATADGNDPIQVMFVGLCATIRSALEKLEALPFRDEFTVAFTEYLTRDISVLDVLNRGVSKGVALAEWAQHQGIRREDVMALGDNWNDRAMLEWAGLPVVMGNSVEGLKSRGWAVTLSNDEAGVAEAIRRYVLSTDEHR